MPHSGPSLESPKPLPDLLKVGLTRPNDPAVTSMESMLTWADLDGQSSQLAASYLALGLKPGDRVPGQAAIKCPPNWKRSSWRSRGRP